MVDLSGDIALEEEAIEFHFFKTEDSLSFFGSGMIGGPTVVS